MYKLVIVGVQAKEHHIYGLTYHGHTKKYGPSPNI
jgi:hypothetical protein